MLSVFPCYLVLGNHILNVSIILLRATVSCLVVIGSRAFRISAPKYGTSYLLTFCNLKQQQGQVTLILLDVI